MTTTLPSAFQEGSSDLAALEGHEPVLLQENKFLKKHVRNWKAEGDWAWWGGGDVAEYGGKLPAVPQDSSLATCTLYSLFAPQLFSLGMMAVQ